MLAQRKEPKEKAPCPLALSGFPALLVPGPSRKNSLRSDSLRSYSAPGLRCSAAGQREGQIASSPLGERSIRFPDVLLLPLRRAEHRSRGRNRSCGCLSAASSTAPARGEKRRAAPAGGRVARALSFGYFSLAAKKSNTTHCKKDTYLEPTGSIEGPEEL